MHTVPTESLKAAMESFEPDEAAHGRSGELRVAME
jgi:hypothetical protein